MGTVKDFVALIFIGTWLLVTLSACETSKHAEIMSAEDLRAQAQMEAAPDTETDTESEQSVIPFEGKPVPSAGLSEAIVFVPEPPPSPAPPAPEPKLTPPAPEPKLTPPAPEPKLTPPAPEPKPASPAPEPKPASPAPEPKSAPPAPEPKSAPPAPEPKSAPPAPEPKSAPPAPEPKSAPPAPEPKSAPPAPEPKSAPPAPEPVVEETVPAEEPVAEPKMEIAKLAPSDFVPEAPEPAPPAPEPKPESGLADVFFDFDQYAIRPDAVPVLEENAGLLKDTYKNFSVLVEGHCDDRGTVEYNLELGKRRAQAVKDYLVDLGIEESRIQIVSYGKEKPFCAESEPSCWQQNRRGHFMRQ